MIDALLRNLQSHDVATDEEKDRLRDIVRVGRTSATGEDIVAEGDRPTYSTLMVDGLSARYKQMADGTRQFTALRVPGDFVDCMRFCFINWITALSLSRRVGSLSPTIRN